MSNQSTHTGLLKVSGIDAKKFLQGQLTCNVEEISPTQSRLGAHCNPQGRVLFIFRLFYFEDSYYLLMSAEMIPHALAFLSKYAVFFKLKLEDASHDAHPSLKTRITQEETHFTLSQGIPQIYPATIGKFLPHDLNLQQMDALSWEKGCYTGQEIIARMHYRGKLKNHLYKASLTTPALPQPGAEVYYTSPQGLAVGGIIVDYCKNENDNYTLLLVASENDVSKATFLLDSTQNETWEWLQ